MRRSLLVLSTILLDSCNTNLGAFLCRAPHRVQYGRETRADARSVTAVRARMQKEGVLEGLAPLLNAVALSQPVQIVARECDTLANFAPASSTISICYDLYRELLAQSATTIPVSKVAVMRWVFYHELGHLIASHLNIPAVNAGGPEEVADNTAAYFLLRSHPEDAQDVVTWLRTRIRITGDSVVDPSDIHMPSLQRFVSTACTFLGAGAPGVAERLVPGDISSERRAQCEEEADARRRGIEAVYGAHVTLQTPKDRAELPQCEFPAGFAWDDDILAAPRENGTASDEPQELELTMMLDDDAVESLGGTVRAITDSDGVAILARCAAVDSTTVAIDSTQSDVCNAPTYLLPGRLTVRFWSSQRDPSCSVVPTSGAALYADFALDSVPRWINRDGRWALTLKSQRKSLVYLRAEMEALLALESACRGIRITAGDGVEQRMWQTIAGLAELQLSRRTAETEFDLSMDGFTFDVVVPSR